MKEFEIDESRPLTVEAALAYVAKYLDLSDQLFNAVRTARGKPVDPIQSEDVQKDLLCLAEWFATHPDIAEQAWTYVLEGARRREQTT